MKKIAGNNSGTPGTLQASSAAISAKPKPMESRAQATFSTPTTTPPTPVWSRYVDSRLKQFCLR